jgi:predicted amidohydrolase
MGTTPATVAAIHLPGSGGASAGTCGPACSNPDPDEWINPGDSVIISPVGEVVAGPLHEAEGILYAECDPFDASRAHRVLDVAGHYGRPDVFQLTIDRSRQRPVEIR